MDGFTISHSTNKSVSCSNEIKKPKFTVKFEGKVIHQTFVDDIAFDKPYVVFLIFLYNNGMHLGQRGCDPGSRVDAIAAG